MLCPVAFDHRQSATAPPSGHQRESPSRCGRYGTYKLVQKMAGGEKLVAFTRILHRQTPDILMDEARS